MFSINKILVTINYVYKNETKKREYSNLEEEQKWESAVIKE